MLTHMCSKIRTVDMDKLTWGGTSYPPDLGYKITPKHASFGAKLVQVSVL